MLTVSDIPAAVSFYQKAFGFSKRAIMKGSDGKPMHAELTLRGTTLMLGPESPEWGTRSAKTLEPRPPVSLFTWKMRTKSLRRLPSWGATTQGPVMDMF
jgi:uncharacterized glyoxalase superfamily protein PhnB